MTTDIIKDLFCGCMSGWGQVISMMPFEHIKIKVVSKNQEYPTQIYALTKTIKQEGVLALYKGMLMPLLGVGAQVSVQFGIVQTLKKQITKTYANKDGKLNPFYSIICGFCAGVPSALTMTALDHARFRVALNKSVESSGSVKTAIKIYKQYGIKKLYLGLNCCSLREVLGLGAYFGTYDGLINQRKINGKVPLSTALFSGGIAGLACWTLIYPIDYVKTLIQTDSLQNPKYKSSVQCALRQYKRSSFKIFFRGFGSMAIRAFVVNATGFMCFEIGKNMMYDK